MKYIPLFDGILDSTLWDESLEVRTLYFTMLLLMDGDFVVRLDFEKIARKARLRIVRRDAFREAQRAMVILMAPDGRTQAEQEYEGRRILSVPGGFLVVNGQKYQDLMFEVNSARRRSTAQRERRRLDKLKASKSTPLTGEASALAAAQAGHLEVAEAIAAERTTEVVPEDNEPDWMTQAKAQGLKEQEAAKDDWEALFDEAKEQGQQPLPPDAGAF
jgi:hypothetical protein